MTGRRLSSSLSYFLLLLAFTAVPSLKHLNEILPNDIFVPSTRDVTCTAAKTKKFLASRVKYYSNSPACFQLERLKVSGDVSSNPGPQNTLKCFLQNVRSLKAAVADGNSFEHKSALFRDVAYGYDLDIICLTETWLNDSITDTELLPTGYNIFRCDRKSRVGGRVLIAVKSYLPSRELTEALSLECVLVEIDLSPNRTALFINCYRPPSDRDFIHNFTKIITSLHVDKYCFITVVGDFNYPGINWIEGSGFTNSDTSEECRFASVLMDRFFYQLVDQPTRINNILDLVLTNSPATISFVESGPSYADAGIPSDHYPVLFDIDVNAKLKHSKCKLRYDFKNADFDSLNKDLSCLPLSSGVSEIKSQEDLNNAWKQWTELVFAAINTHIPTVPRRDSNKPPWINKDLAKAINRKKTLWRRVKKTKNPQLIEKFRKLRQSLKNWVRRERKAYLRAISDEAFTNPKRFWSYFSFKNKKRPVPDKVTYKGVSITDDLARAEAFNEFFKSIYKDHLSCEVPNSCPVHPDIPELLHLIQVSCDDVCSILSTLDMSKATGPDKLPTIVLRKCAEALSPSLTVFINTSLKTGYYISDWKHANIPPVHKKGNRAEVENFRQISLLPIVSKVQEKCVAKQLVPHASLILKPCQYGFQSGLSCASQLITVFHDICNNLDKGLESDIIYLDFAKAFDSVCHRKLLWKLEHYGVSGPLLKWFGNYLTGRKQRVVINGCYSSWAVVKSGVPQGSILGPILFLLYVNDMSDVVRNSCIAMFADDSKCYRTITSASDSASLQLDLNALSEWSSSNELAFQPKKCENLRISRKRYSFDRSYYINFNAALNCVSTQRDLGVTITSDLTWNSHIDTISAKANRMLGFLKRNCTKDLSRSAIKTLYLALVRSHLGYCSQLWAPQSVIRNILQLESVQRRATRFICKAYSDPRPSYRDRLVDLNLLPINYWLEYLDLVFFYKCQFKIINIDTTNFVHLCSGRSRRASSGLYFRPTTVPKTSNFRDSYFLRITSLWNTIPDEIKSSPSLPEFKRELRNFLFRRLKLVFNQDDIRTYKLICPKCRRANTYFVCSC